MGCRGASQAAKAHMAMGTHPRCLAERGQQPWGHGVAGVTLMWWLSVVMVGSLDTLSHRRGCISHVGVSGEEGRVARTALGHQSHSLRPTMPPSRAMKTPGLGLGSHRAVLPVVRYKIKLN